MVWLTYGYEKWKHRSVSLRIVPAQLLFFFFFLFELQMFFFFPIESIRLVPEKWIGEKT